MHSACDQPHHGASSHSHWPSTQVAVQEQTGVLSQPPEPPGPPVPTGPHCQLPELQSGS